MSTPHNSAAPGDFAKTVLMPGDPLRAQYIAENFLDDRRLVNNVRGIQGYTGTYKGVPVSVMASGMGMPSMGIYSYELFNFYGVENILRVGSVGALSEKLHVRDIVLAQGACTNSAYAAQFGCRGAIAPIADYGLLRTDFLTHLFPGSRRLFELADSITEIKTICECGSKATVNARIDGEGHVVTEGAQVFLGGNDSYIAMCHACWRKRIARERAERAQK